MESLLIDEDLYSRQLYVLGSDAMRKITSSNIIISGLGGLGAEIAKNLILMGVKSVTLHDDSECQIKDLSSNFFLTEFDIGKNRAKACRPHLSELNKYVITKVYEGCLEEDILKRFQVVVLLGKSFEEQIRISEITHKENIKLIIADTRGIFSQVFCDFGKEFYVLNKNGETPVSRMISEITQDTEGVVHCFEGLHHGLDDGEFVWFTEVEGMTELNGCLPRKVLTKTPSSFFIGDTSTFSEYTRGGMFHQVKTPTLLEFKCFKEALFNPKFVITDFGKPHHALHLHLAFRTLHEFIRKNGCFPRPWSENDSDSFLSISEKLKKNNIENLEKSILKTFAKTCTGELNPMNAVVGGIVSQEILKACTGKCMPIYQWLYFDAIECLPKDSILDNDLQIQNSRYDGQTIVFGNSFQEKLGNLNYFIVGTGAIGSEILKNFTLMGVGVKNGSLIISDMSKIRKSNLNLQFLFKPRHVNKAKSLTLSEIIKDINPEMKIFSHVLRVSQETEITFNESFYENLSGIVSAVNGIESKIYLSHQSIRYRKPLIDIDILGTKGNIELTIPFLTNSSYSFEGLFQNSTPKCTLESFPNSTDHAIKWATSIFEYYFYDTLIYPYLFINKFNYFEECLTEVGVQPIEIVREVIGALGDDKPKNFEDCVYWARSLWQELFYNNIRSLLINFPPEQTTEIGTLFWSGPKRCPVPLDFSADDELHLDFVYAGANLRAETYGITQNRDRNIIKKILKTSTSHVHCQWNKIKFPNEISMKNDFANTLEPTSLDELRNKLFNLKNQEYINICPVSLDKDDDTNLHIDFILAASNLRATNYQIALADRLETKLVAGKITPAIVTTASTLAGLSCLELYKLTAESISREEYKNCSINLATNVFGFSEPLEPIKQSYNDWEWTIWDRFEVLGETTLEEFLDFFKKTHSLHITMLSHGITLLYNSFVKVSKERLSLPMTQVIENVSKKKNDSSVKTFMFELSCTDKKGRNIDVLYVLYRIP